MMDNNENPQAFLENSIIYLLQKSSDLIPNLPNKKFMKHCTSARIALLE